MKKMCVWLLMALGLGGCASEVTRHPVDLSRARQPPDKSFVASQTVMLRLDSGYDRSIRAGTEFVDVGGIAQGDILKPTNANFTVEGAHMHEAYLVVRRNLKKRATSGRRWDRGRKPRPKRNRDGVHSCWTS